MLIFYAGAFGYIGKLDFVDNKGCCYNEPVSLKGTISISTAIPVHEEDTSNVAGQLKEGGIDLDIPRVPSGLMHLAEYYMAVRALYQNPDIKVVIFDRMPSIDIPHLISNVEDWSCIQRFKDLKSEIGDDAWKLEIKLLDDIPIQSMFIIDQNTNSGIMRVEPYLFGIRKEERRIQEISRKNEKTLVSNLLQKLWGNVE